MNRKWAVLVQAAVIAIAAYVLHIDPGSLILFNETLSDIVDEEYPQKPSH